MTLNEQQFIALLPILITGATTVVVMLAIAFARNHWWNATLTVVGLNLALGSVFLVAKVIPQTVTPLLVVDGYSCFYMVLILVITLACATLAHAYMEDFAGNREEIYLLLTLAASGALVLACSRHMASLFIGLELLSVPIYGMVAYTFRNHRSLEGGIKYMVLSAAASTFLLFGMALLYAHSGTLSFQGLSTQFTMSGLHSPLLVAGALLILIGLGFKLSFAPFHMWTPDVYEGAPAPVGAFLATASKTAVLAVLVRFLLEASAESELPLREAMAVIAFLSILVGNFLALTQTNIKRLLGYSSIAHLGYLLVAVVAANHLESEAVAMYLITYVATTLGAFGVVALMSDAGRLHDADAIFNYRGLFWRRPYLTAVLTVMMLSLAGIPLTAGFIGKFYVIAAGVDAKLWWLLGALVVGSGVGLYYYLRVIVALYLAEPSMVSHDARLDWGQRAGGIMVLALAGLVLLLGIFPQPFIDLIRDAGITALHLS